MSLAIRAAVMALFVGLDLEAQATPADTSARKFGIGVFVSPTAIFVDELGFLPIGLNNVLFPIRLSPAFTLEPEIGLLRVSSSSGGSETRFNNTRIGVGFLFSLRERAGLQPYIGPRIGFARSTTDGGGTSTKQTSWLTSLVWGAQHYFSSHFSLGGELQLTRVSVSGDETLGSSDQTFTTTTGLATIRWFF